MGRGDADAVWSALSHEGWLEALPESADEWSTIEVARLVVELAAGAGADVSVGPYFAAAATLTETDALAGESLSLAVAVDLIDTGGEFLKGRGWGSVDADVIVAS